MQSLDVEPVPASRIDRKSAEARLQRLFGPGPLQRMPRRVADRDLLLALAACEFEARRDYRETEVNDLLQGFLGKAWRIDHVTLRRYLVDHGFLLRERDGSSYRCNVSRLTAALEADAMTLVPARIYSQRRAERVARRQGTRGS